MAKKEIKRTLTPAEEKRTAYVRQLLEKEYYPRGYKSHDMIVSLVTANIFGIVLIIPVAIAAILLLLVLHGDPIRTWDNPLPLLGLTAAIVAAIPVHEWIHGFTWSRFTEKGWKSIEFGFIAKALTPYCTCLEPMSRKAYLTGTLMPGLVLGLIPTILGVLFGSFLVTFFGIMMISAAAGDILIAWKIYRFKEYNHKVLYMDHPSEAGLIALIRAEESCF